MCATLVRLAPDIERKPNRVLANESISKINMHRYNLLTLMVLAVIYSVVAQVMIPPRMNCSSTERYSPCGRVCEQTCDNPNPQNNIFCRFLPCFAPFTQGCRCRQDLVRDMSTGNCIPCRNCTNNDS